MARQHPADLRKRLTRRASEQAGYFTAKQALQVGYSYASQRYHAANGDWQRVSRGLYRLPEWPVSEHDHLVRWVLWSDNEATISHETALSAAGLGDYNPAQVHLTVPPGFRRTAPDGIVLHKATLEEGDIQSNEGYRTTAPLRSLVDVAAGPGATIDLLAGAIREAFDRGVLTRRTLQAAAERAGPQAALNIERALSVVEVQ